MRILPMGDTALLVEVEPPEPAAVLALDRALRGSARRPPQVRDLVPAAVTLLVTFDAGGDVSQVRRWLESVTIAAPPGRPGRPGRQADGDRRQPGPVDVVLEVDYDGDDLDEVGALTGLGAAGVVAAHGSSTWTVAFTGFAPGFGYLVGGDPRLQVPRLATPRTRVPAGSVALAGPYCGVYPTASPGGWRLIGRTEAVIWDVDRDPPALLRPGARVRFQSR